MNSLAICVSGLLTACLAAGCATHHAPQGDAAIPVFQRARIATGLTIVTSAGVDARIPSPVYKLVHHAVNTGDIREYFAMASPWRANSGSFPTPTLLVEQFSYRAPLAMGFGPTSWHASAGLAPQGLGVATARVATASSGTADYDVVGMTATAGTGWIYFTGQNPIVKTKRVIGASDGTTFCCQVATRGTTEYYRFALLFPTGSPTTSTVDLSLCDSPDVVAITIDVNQPYAVYEYPPPSTNPTGWTQSATIGTGNLWDDFATVLSTASDQARRANLSSIY